MDDGPQDRPGRPAVDDPVESDRPAASPSDPSDARDEPARDNEPGLLDDIADRLGFRDFIRRHKTLELVYRIGVAVLGVTIILVGLALIPLPGPGWLIVFAGLALLATEFAWAERLLHYGRSKLHAWTQWVLRQSLAIRALITVASLGVVAGVLWLYVAVQGVPGWLPVIG